MEHRYFQRLRRIQQLGLSSYVYPGAVHTRFHHALGATHLMNQAISILQDKGVDISEEEAEAVSIAILFHDAGHGPFSHALEYTIVNGITHEEISHLLLAQLNKEFNGRLTMAIEIFADKYPKKFLHQLVSSQLDMDRLDYLTRDSFFTGVSEGVVGYDRIIKMLNVKDDQLVVEEKGIYSIEKFIISRRLMYWQVYLHKAVLSAESMAVKVLQRAAELVEGGKKLNSTSSLDFFLSNKVSKEDFSKLEVLEKFAELDDYDIFSSLKEWKKCDDYVLAELSRRIIERDLLKIELRKEPFSPTVLDEMRGRMASKHRLSIDEIKYLVYDDSTSNSAYTMKSSQINILFKNGEVKDIALASDNLNLTILTEPVVKYYLCYPKES